MNRIVEILMNRDGLTQAEAEDQLHEVSEMVDEAVSDGRFEDVEDILACELGLEMDYIMDLI